MARSAVIAVVMALLLFSGCGTGRNAIGVVGAGEFAGNARSERMKMRLDEYVADKDARIGIAVIIDGQDTVEVNGRRDFPMLSVYKFPQAIAVADYCRRHGMAFSDSVLIESAEIKENTWSPLREKYGIREMALTIRELLEFSLQQSDNNACDILFRLIGGVEKADSVMESLGFDGIEIGSTEDEMHRDIYLCYHNRATPIMIAGLLERFDTEMRHESPELEEIAHIMENCATGGDRLAAPLASTGAMIGHKTGTGDINSQNRIIGINDAGWVRLPDGRRYVAAVFIADSAYDMKRTSEMIAEMSSIIYSTITE